MMFSSSGGGPSAGQTCSLVLIFAVLLQSICVAITFLYFTNELQQLRATYSESNLACFSREDVLLQDMDADNIDESDPCWQVKWQLSRLIKKIVAKHRLEDAISGAASSATGHTSQVSTATEREASKNAVPRVAAHLTANQNWRHPETIQSLPLRNNLGYKINTWEASRDSSSFLYNLRLNNGELVIPQTGIYYIYSQTYFRFREPEGVEPDADPDSDSVRNPKQMVQFISKYTDYYPDPILMMKSARTSCWSKKAGYGLYSIYQGGLFQLNVNDRIFVSISNKDLVDMDKPASFFGAFLVS
ncbi:tumor necrosis factor ligand superfamily member 10 [Anolis sagrei]|uniref:tumor necrosis factor ligand superfamily member 10 n=1 Tax=Anolis sagrei TaxID=38937 RepID=UPI0035206EB4